MADQRGQGVVDYVAVLVVVAAIIGGVALSGMPGLLSHDIGCVISKTFNASACTRSGRGVAPVGTHGGAVAIRSDAIPTGGGQGTVSKPEEVEEILNSPKYQAMVQALSGAVKLAFEHYLENRILQIAAAAGDPVSVQEQNLENARRSGGLAGLLTAVDTYLTLDSADCIGRTNAGCNIPLIKYTNAVGAKIAESHLSFYLNALSWSSLGLVPLGLADKLGTNLVSKLAEDTLGSILTRGAIGATGAGGATTLSEVLSGGHVDPAKVLLASLSGAAAGAAPSERAVQFAAAAAGINEFGDQLIDGKGVDPIKVLEAGAFGAVLGKLSDLYGSDGAKNLQGSLAVAIGTLCSNPVDGSSC